jgi:streptogramin lyase
MRQRLVAAAIATAGSLWAFGFLAFAQAPVRGTITGTVAAAEGKVIGLRVAAHNLDQRLWYIVFTNKGQYKIPQALPGRYEITVNEPGFGSPKESVQLRAGGTQTVDFSLDKLPDDPRPAVITGNMGGAAGDGMEGGGNGKPGTPRKILFFNTLEEVYPPGPGRDLIKANCTGCHADDLTTYHYTQERFLTGIEKMTETGPAIFPNVLALGRTPLSTKEKQFIAGYLAANFGPGMPDKRLRVAPLAVDEETASKAIYVSYDIPDEVEKTKVKSQGIKVGANMIDGEFEMRPGLTVGALQAAAISPLDGTIWFSSRGSNSILGLNPRELDPAKRWKNYPVKGDPFVAVSGIAVDSKGKVYWSELSGGMLGELDPVTGKQIRYVIPQKGVGVGLTVDKDDNVCFSLIWGAQFGRLDAKTRTIHTYPTPTPDNGIYGVVADKNGVMWGAGWQKGTISKWSPESSLVTEYPIPTSWGQMRRIGVDSKGIVWSSASNTGQLVRLDPATGRTTDFKVPVQGANPYEAWPDKQDNVWTADQTHSSLMKLDPKTGKWIFYPMPQPRQSVPKIEVDDRNTLWFGTRGKTTVVAVHFYPNGYTVDQPPIP